MTTPAQLAKQFAADKGFTITPRGRRYAVGYIEVEIAEVGGYPAALNVMQRHLDAQKTRESMAFLERVVPPEQWQQPEPLARAERKPYVAILQYANPYRMDSGEFVSRGEALKAVRRLMNDPRNRPHRVNILYVHGA